MKKIAVFDFNGTLLPYDFGPLFLRYHKEFFKKDLIVVRTYLRIASKIIKYKVLKSYTKEQFHGDAINDLTYTLKGFDRTNIDAFFGYCGENIAKLLDEEVLLELERVKAEGYYTIVLSGTYTEFLEHLIKHIDIDLAIGSDLVYDKIGDREFLNCSKKLKVVKNEAKALKVKETLSGIDYENSIAYADSYFDKPILDLVGKPVCVNPDEKLLEIAKAQNYQILYTKHRDCKMD